MPAGGFSLASAFGVGVARVRIRSSWPGGVASKVTSGIQARFANKGLWWVQISFLPLRAVPEPSAFNLICISVAGVVTYLRRIGLTLKTIALADRIEVGRTRKPGGVGGEEPRGSPRSRSTHPVPIKTHDSLARPGVRGRPPSCTFASQSQPDAS